MSSNRRQDPRIRTPSVGVRIRKRGIGLHRWSNDSILVNVSSSGICITSNKLNLKTLNKVQFELTLDEKLIAGRAIVCYASHQGEYKKYGLLFISANTEINQLLESSLLSTLSTNEAKRLGEESAERLMEQLTHRQNPDNGLLELNQRNQLMLDSATAMATRLGEMGLKIKDEFEQIQSPEKVLKVTPEGHLSFPALTSSNGIARFSISCVKYQNSYVYELSCGDKIDNLTELLDYLFTCFEQISTTHQ